MGNYCFFVCLFVLSVCEEYLYSCVLDSKQHNNSVTVTQTKVAGEANTLTHCVKEKRIA